MTRILRWLLQHEHWIADVVGCLIVWVLISVGLIALLSL